MLAGRCRNRRVTIDQASTHRPRLLSIFRLVVWAWYPGGGLSLFHVDSVGSRLTCWQGGLALDTSSPLSSFCHSPFSPYFLYPLSLDPLTSPPCIFRTRAAAASGLYVYITALRHPDTGIPTRNIRYKYKYYRDVFTGIAACQWFLRNMDGVDTVRPVWCTISESLRARWPLGHLTGLGCHAHSIGR